MNALRQQRKLATRELAASLEPWSRRDLFPKWRHKLSLS
jgi:hypothetical protein